MAYCLKGNKNTVYFGVKKAHNEVNIKIPAGYQFLPNVHLFMVENPVV